MRELKAVITDPITDLVRVQVTFTSPSGDRASGCTKESTATAKVRLPEPLGDRDVIVDNYTRFTAMAPTRPRFACAESWAAHRRPPAAPPTPTIRR
ncbi:hypothetical protein [Streptomyces sp. NPDC001978]|uniref:hypothetical protein n=1 Tax=Streptomyces sp. NPDC001978 TaxID=3364627 RepID=UPI00368915CE